MPVPPLQTCGPVPNSGDMSTLRTFQCIGGTRAYTMYSGIAGGGAVIWSGAGILNTVFVERRLASGISTSLLDCGSFVSGLVGFAGDSGMNFLGRVPATYDAGVMVSGSAIDTPFITARPIILDSPFASGLAFSTGSGFNPFTVTFTPTRTTPL